MFVGSKKGLRTRGSHENTAFFQGLALSKPSNSTATHRPLLFEKRHPFQSYKNPNLVKVLVSKENTGYNVTCEIPERTM